MTETFLYPEDEFLPTTLHQQPAFPPTPLLWCAATPAEQQHHLDNLDEWVGWLSGHYRLDRRHIPECWTEHWELIEELSALRQAWEGAYASTASADSPLTWHERFAAARIRLAEWVARTGCRPGEHRGG